MTDVYRAPGYACPRCAGAGCSGAALRVYGERLVCDECHGMMLGAADFRRACEEDAGAPLTVAFVDAHDDALAREVEVFDEEFVLSAHEERGSNSCGRDPRAACAASRNSAVRS